MPLNELAFAGALQEYHALSLVLAHFCIWLLAPPCLSLIVILIVQNLIEITIVSIIMIVILQTTPPRTALPMGAGLGPQTTWNASAWSVDHPTQLIVNNMHMHMYTKAQQGNLPLHGQFMSSVSLSLLSYFSFSLSYFSLSLLLVSSLALSSFFNFLLCHSHHCHNPDCHHSHCHCHLSFHRIENA